MTFMVAVIGALASVLFFTLWVITSIFFASVQYPVAVPMAMGYILAGACIALCHKMWRAKHTKRSTSIPFVHSFILGTLTSLFLMVLLIINSPDKTYTIRQCVLLFISVHASMLTLRLIFRNLSLSLPEEKSIMFARLMRAYGFTFFIVVTTFPFYFMVFSSLTPRALFLQNPVDMTIRPNMSISQLFSGYKEVMTTFKFGRYILNSTIISLLTVVITLIPAFLGAYAITRLKFPGRKFFANAILIVYMFPAIVLAVPLYSIFSGLGLKDSSLVLLVVYPAITIPVALYMLKSYLQSLPYSIEEAGRIDGCSRLQVIWRITVPLSVPALLSVGLYVFMIAWNEFLFAYIFLDSPRLFTLSRGVVSLNSMEVPRQFLMAGSVIITVPIMVIFFYFQRFLVGGLTSGSVKG